MKQMTRGKMFPKRVWALAALAVLAISSIVAVAASAQQDQEDGNSPVGSWSVTVTVTNPQGVPSFPVLMTFHSDGTMMQSRPSYIPAFGVLETTHHGAWKRMEGNRIAATTLSLSQGAPGNTVLNGAFFGTEKVSFQPVISADGKSFTAQWTSTVFDPNNNPIVQGSGTLSGVRIQVEP